MCPQTTEEKNEMKNIPYRQAIGSLLFLAMISRPDISFSVNVLSRFCENPGKEHWNGIKRILRYLKGTPNFVLEYGNSSETLVGYADADWGSDIDERKSTTGYVFTMYGGAVSWCCKKQPTVALSSTEAEYMSATASIQESVWLKNFLREIFSHSVTTITIHCDNKGAVCILKNNAHSSRTEHIDIKYRYICEMVANNEVMLTYIPTDKNPADLLTKGISVIKMQKHLTNIGINNPIIE